MYDQLGESSLNYHELLTEFLQHLCERTRKGPPFSPATAPRAVPTQTPGPTPGPTTPTGGSPARGGASATGAIARRPICEHPPVTATAATSTTPSRSPGMPSTARQPSASPPICALRPVIALLTSTLRGGTRAGVAGIAVEGRDRRAHRPPRRPRRVEEQRHGRTRQAEAPVADAGERRDLLGQHHRDRPGRQLRTTNGTIVVQRH